MKETKSNRTLEAKRRAHAGCKRTPQPPLASAWRSAEDMRTTGLLLLIAGLACGGWSAATFVMRNTYFRPLADSPAYVAAREAGDQLARDLFYPTIASSGALVALGGTLLFRKRKEPIQSPQTTRVSSPRV